MDEQVDPQTKKRRSAVLRRQSERKTRDYNESFIGKELDVLFESFSDDHWSGYTPNYIRVSVPSTDKLENEIRRVKITEIAADFVMGELV